MTKEQWRERNKQQMYGAVIFLAWMGIIILLQSFVPGAALFIKQTWWVFGAAGMLLMGYLTFKSHTMSVSDAATIPFMLLLGPVGAPFVLTWMALVRIQTARYRKVPETKEK